MFLNWAPSGTKPSHVFASVKNKVGGHPALLLSVFLPAKPIKPCRQVVFAKQYRGTALSPKILWVDPFELTSIKITAPTAACFVWLEWHIKMVQLCGLKITNDFEAFFNKKRFYLLFGNKDSFHLFSDQNYLVKFLWFKLWTSLPIRLLMTVYWFLLWLFAGGW